MKIVGKGMLIMLLIIPLIISCSRHSAVSDTLAHAEAIMEEHPDSALAILEAIPDSTLTSRGDRALHALLLSQAQYKNRIDVPSDSLINIAVNYYSGKSNYYEMLANFQKSLIAYYSKDYSTSTLTALKAKTLAESLSDTLFIARTNEHLADLYFLNYDLTNDIIFRKASIEAYDKCGKKLNALYAKIDLAISYTKQERYQTAIDVLNEIDSDYCVNDTIFMRYYHNSFIIPLLRLGHKEKALDEVNKLHNYIETDEDYNDEELCNTAHAYLSNNCLTAGRKYIDLLLKNNPGAMSQILTQEIMLKLYLTENNKNKIIELYDSLLTSQNQVVESILMTRIMEVEKNYYRDVSQKSQNERNRLLSWFIIVGIVIVLLIITIVLIVILHRIKTSNTKLKLDNMVEIIQHMKLSIDHKDLEINKINNTVKSSQRYVSDLFNQNFYIIKQLNNLYDQESIDSPKARLLYKKMNQAIAKFSEPQIIDEMEFIVNKYQDDVMMKLRSALPDLPSYLNRVALYTFLGFSSGLIAILLNTSRSNVYVYKSKLKKIIKDSTHKVPHEIMQFFESDSKH